MTPVVVTLLSAVGYDPAIVKLLPRGEARFFVFASALSVGAALLAGLSLGYGAGLAVGIPAAVVLAPLTALFVLNLLRLHHAGSGYPLHLPLELIPGWRPAGAAVVVLFTLGLLITQPLVMLVQKPWLDVDVAAHAAAERALRDAAGADDSARVVVSDGLIVRGRAAYDVHPLSSSLLALLFASIIAGPALLRRTRASVLRRYESERWIIERMFVDDEWARCQDAVVAMLQPLPTFSGSLSAHYGDPPYNTRPLVFGLDPALVVSGRVKFTRGKEAAGPETTTTTTTTTTSPLPAPAPAPVAVAVAPAVVLRPASTSPPRPPSPQEVERGEGTRIPAGPVVLLSITDTARTSAASARTTVPAAFIARYLGRGVDDVERVLAAADDDLPLHKVFPEWNKLPTILLKDAGFALDHGMARVLAIIVERDVEQVLRRLRAAPREKSLSGVFAPELARRLLNKRT
ncbi:MAG: hypothetical protein Q8O67_22025 [Deltaproteobacteria bacterium]|nr:hypothetical protein [Deltaproteobacteria bacterium]